MDSKKNYFVFLSQLVKEFDLEVISGNDILSEVRINVPEVSRPGLALKGFFDYFVEDRIQIVGMAEHAFLETLSDQERDLCLRNYFKYKFPCIVLSRSLPAFEELRIIASEHRIPLLRTSEETSRFLSSVISYLNLQLAPRITVHGVLVDVYGEGILITGESGSGKSETALELVRRGHRLVADDAVEIKKVSEKTIIGNAPENIKHLIEIRGIGILNVKDLFGIAAVMQVQKIDLVVNLEIWDETKEYDRLGIEEHCTTILGIEIPILNIPVAPGRNLAVIIEAASINNRQRKFGYNTARELSERLERFLGDMENKV